LADKQSRIRFSDDLHDRIATVCIALRPFRNILLKLLNIRSVAFYTFAAKKPVNLKFINS